MRLCCEPDFNLAIFLLNFSPLNTFPVMRSAVEVMRSGEMEERSATDLERDLRAEGVRPAPASAAASIRAASR